jgi:hypothetical protein
MTEKLCNGCYTIRCIIAHNSPKRMKICPCQICLIKMTCMEQCEKYRRLVTGLFPTSYADYKKMKITPISFVASEQYMNDPNKVISIHKGTVVLGSKVIYLNSDLNPSYFRPNGIPVDIYFEE